MADTQCGFKLFDGARARAAFAAARVDGWGFDVEVLALFARRGWPVAEVPVRWTHRPGSKVRPLDYLRVLREIAGIRARHGLSHTITNPTSTRPATHDADGASSAGNADGGGGAWGGWVAA
ncbi:hypothetical protein ACFQHO_44210 [Actinomadura yumaensis]|uniref:hypothetical protein n=1 Tax=Actinomadura yumaensis TaxID=111807 RepID=UPI0036195091